MNIQLPDFTKTSILVIGDVMLDRYWFGETSRISPEAPVPVVKVNQVDERPGGAGNVALNIAALGTRAMLLGVTGKDQAADILKQQLTAANVLHDLCHMDSIPTITKLRVISRHQQLLRLDFEEKFPVFDPTLLLNAYQTHLPKAKLVILSDYHKGTLQYAAQLIRLAKQAGIPLIVDPKGSDFSIYRGADVITPNLKEFETIVGVCHHEQDMLDKGRALLEQHDIKAMLLTRGERGMTLIQREEEELHFPAHAKEVFDVTGAGDTVIAIFGAALASGSSYAEAMVLANLGASLVVAKLGAASVSAAELKAALSVGGCITGGVVNEEQLYLAVSEARIQGKRIVFTNGCFDILHAGHVTYLQQAKKLGDYLIVAINDDPSVKRLKGLDRPVNPVEQRMAVLAGLGAVDWVLSYSDDTPIRLLKKLQPDILVKGGDYGIDGVVGAEVVRAYGGDVRVLGVVKSVSTTAILDRIKQDTFDEQKKESVTHD